VLAWILERCSGRKGAQDTAIGYLPHIADLQLEGANVPAAALQELTTVHTDAWQREVADFRRYLEEFGDRTPAELLVQLDGVAQRLSTPRS